MEVRILFVTRKHNLINEFIVNKLFGKYSEIAISIDNVWWYMEEGKVVKDINSPKSRLERPSINYKYHIEEELQNRLEAMLDTFIGIKENRLNLLIPNKTTYRDNTVTMRELAIRTLAMMGIDVYLKEAVNYTTDDLIKHINLHIEHEDKILDKYGISINDDKKLGTSILEHFSVQPSDYFKILARFNLPEQNGALFIMLNSLNAVNVKYIEDILEVKFSPSRINFTIVKLTCSIERIDTHIVS